MYSPTKKDLIDQNNTRIGKNPKKIIIYGSRKLNQLSLDISKK